MRYRGEKFLKMKPKLSIDFEENKAENPQKRKFCRQKVVYGILGSLLLTWAVTGIRFPTYRKAELSLKLKLVNL